MVDTVNERKEQTQARMLQPFKDSQQAFFLEYYRVVNDQLEAERNQRSDLLQQMRFEAFIQRILEENARAQARQEEMLRRDNRQLTIDQPTG